LDIIKSGAAGRSSIKISSGLQHYLKVRAAVLGVTIETIVDDCLMEYKESHPIALEDIAKIAERND